MGHLIDGRSEDLRASVVGLGLIGGSIAKRLVQAGWDVSGTDPDPDTCRSAAATGIRVVDSLADLDGSAPIVIATPTPVTITLLESAAIPAGTGLVIDTASTKTGVVAAAARHYGHRFVGTHPMAGKSDGGFAQSEPGLLVGATWALTPGEGSPPGQLSEAMALIGEVFEAPMSVLRAGTHDQMVARTSHLPHVLGQLLVHTVEANTPLASALAAGSFEGATRVVRGSPTFPSELVWANRDQVTQVLNAVFRDLHRVRDALAVGSKPDLDAWFEQSDLDAGYNETAAVPVPGNARELDELVAFGEAGWLACWGGKKYLTLRR